MNFIAAAVLVSDESIFNIFTRNEMETILLNESKKIINCLTLAVYLNNRNMIQKIMSYKCKEIYESFN